MKKLHSLAFILALGLAPIIGLSHIAMAEELFDDTEREDGLTLREQITVDDDLVRLGDLFVEAIDDADIPIAQAPKPGESSTLDARFLRNVAQAYQLNWRPASRVQRVVVTRMSQRVGPDQVETALLAAIRDKLQSAADLEVTLDGGDRTFDLPTNVDNSVAVKAINYNPTSKRFAAQIVAPAEGPTIVDTTIFGSVAEVVQVPVPIRLISAGEIIGPSDLDWISVNVDRLAAFMLTDAQQLIGQTAKRPLRAGQVLRQTDVTLTPIVKKNGLVQLVVKSGQMTLTARGRALEDGSYGQVIRVVNIDTNHQLSGVVQDGTIVNIVLDGQSAIN